MDKAKACISPHLHNSDFDAHRNIFPFVMRRWIQSPMYAVVFNRCPCNLSDAAGITNKARDFWHFILWPPRHSWRLLARKPTNREANNDLDNYRPNCDWHDFHLGLRWYYAYTDSSEVNAIVINVAHCPWCNWRNQYSCETKADQDGQKWVYHETLSEGRERS